MKSALKGDKFRNLPDDNGVRLIFRQPAKLDDFEVLYEMWILEGILAESVIFANEDVANRSDEEIIAWVQSLRCVDEKLGSTFCRSRNGFTYVNYNFKIY